MKISRTRPAFQDERGEITDILVGEVIEYATLIKSVRGAVRGNHYHKETVQWLYVLDGSVKVLTQSPGQPVVATILKAGDLILNEPMERHAVIALEDSSFFVFTRGPRGGEDYELDSYRLDEPIQEV